MRQICDYGDKSGNPCGKSAVWVLAWYEDQGGMKRKQQLACHVHVGPLLLQLYEFRRLTQDSPQFTVERW